MRSVLKRLGGLDAIKARGPLHPQFHCLQLLSACRTVTHDDTTPLRITEDEVRESCREACALSTAPVQLPHSRLRGS